MCRQPRPLRVLVQSFPIIMKEIIMLNVKEDCARYFATHFRKNASWRIGNAIKFPSDGRNALAAEHLLELKSNIEISDAMWGRLSPHYNETDACWCAAVSETNGHVGFRQHPRDFAAWVDNLLSNLTAIKQVRK
jgi:hypothetical protein